ncbi:MAG: homoserine kinase [Gemmatimonadaceae bacterium]
MSRRALVRVPASVSNLGAGFDHVGVAVDRRLTLSATLDPESMAPVTIERAGTLAGLALDAGDDLLVAGVRAACDAAGRAVPTGLGLRVSSQIPVARGLGSSAAATVAGAVAADALLQLRLGDHALAAAAAAVEGHADNVAPAIWGGATLVLTGADGALVVAPLRVAPSLALVLAIPDFTVRTEQARAVLPATVPHATAVRAGALGAALVQGLATGDDALLAVALTGDVLHVPYRRALIPGYDDVVAAAVAAGAHGATLSGSGSSLVAIAPTDRADAVAGAMRTAWAAAGVTAETLTSGSGASGYTVSVQAVCT